MACGISRWPDGCSENQHAPNAHFHTGAPKIRLVRPTARRYRFFTLREAATPTRLA